MSGLTLPASVRAEPGSGGLRRLVVSGPSGNAEIYLQGAHLTAWAPVGQGPVIWMSRHSTFAEGCAIRGGVPVCFPWFGPHRTGAGPLHGFARTSRWTLVEAREEGPDVVLVLTLSEADIPAHQVPAWPHAFLACYTVTVGATLTLALEVTNPAASPVTFQEAFHTYLGVGDVGEVTIRGLESSGYLDRLAGTSPSPPDGEPLCIVEEVDRLYEQPGTILVQDRVGRRTVAVTASGSANAVVWNPWQAKAAAMGDFGDHDWTQMVCIETCNVLDGEITLDPGLSHRMVATVALPTD